MDYFVELDRVCSSVHSELDSNRRKRDHWYNRNQSWKNAWLSGNGSSDPNSGFHSRSQESVE